MSNQNRAPSRYAKAHLDRNGPGDARPTGIQIVKDNGLVNGLKDKVYSSLR